MTFVHFTNPLGRVVSIKRDQIVNLRDPEDGMYAPGTRTVIVLTNGIFQAVKEPMDVVEAKLSCRS